jgi:hypothetical protein
VPLKADFYEDPKIIHAGEAAELLYVHMLAYCSRTFTDGFIDDAQMTRLGLKRVEKRAATLAQHALISRVDDGNSHGYRVTAWLKHNPSVKEIAKAHEHESTAGKRGNHLRWHVQQDIVVEGCPWCKSPDSMSESHRVPDRVPDGSESGDPIEPESQDTETASTTASATTTAPDPIPANDSQEDDPRFDVVCRLLAKRAADKAGKIGTTRARYEKGALRNTVAERGDEIRTLLRDRPSASAEQIVDLLERGNGYHVTRRDPEANRKKIDAAGEDDDVVGMFDEVPEPVRASWVENPAPLPPELLARARHEEDELVEVAS